VALLEQIPPGDWRRDALLGDAYQLLGAYVQAGQAYEASLSRTEQIPQPLLVDLATLQETHLKDRKAANQTWAVYVKTHPKGYAAPRAHLALGLAAHEAGRWDTAQVHFWTVLGQFGDAPQSGVALSMLGGRLLKERRWSDAETFFEQYNGGQGVKAEAAVVGLVRVYIAQGQAEAAMMLIAEYEERFPRGTRQREVQRLQEALDADSEDL